MPRRTNPWPAFVDLFSALLIATFAGFTMLSGAYQHDVSVYQQAEVEKKKMRVEADKIVERVRNSLDRDNTMKNKIRDCGDDTCIELYIHFERDKDVIVDPEELKSLETLCRILKGAIDELDTTQRQEIELFIDGHTDSQQPKTIADERERYLFNWNLSARRASAVLYTFQQCGLTPPDYRIVSIGFADSMPLCQDATENCYALNRRTTLRLRANTQHIETRLKQSGDASKALAPLTNK